MVARQHHHRTRLRLLRCCPVGRRYQPVRWRAARPGDLGGAVLITIYLLTSAIGGVIGGAFSVLGGTLSAAGQGLKSAAPELASAAGLSPDLLQQQAQAYLQPRPLAGTVPTRLSSAYSTSWLPS